MRIFVVGAFTFDASQVQGVRRISIQRLWWSVSE